MPTLNSIGALFADPADEFFPIFAPPPAPSVSLLVDSGSDDADLLTNDPHLAITNVAGATVEFSFDGINWSTTPPSGMPDGRYTIQVRQTVIEGVDTLVSPVSSITFTLDTTPPPALTVALQNDTGSDATDGITTDYTLNVTGQETGTVVEYSLDGGVNWSTDTPSGLALGNYTLLVRQMDAAGNYSTPAELHFTVAAEPAALVLALVEDTGSSDSDLITNNADIAVTNVATGATVTYFIDGDTVGVSNLPADWVDGSHTIIARQTDSAGVSDETTFTFTLDTVAPDVLELALANDDGTSSTDNITTDEALDITGLETGATAEYSLDGGQTWSATAPTGLDAGTYTVTVRQTDIAGNVSDISALTFTLIDTAPTPTPTDPFVHYGVSSDGPGGLGAGTDFGW